MGPEASTRRWGAAVGLSLLLHALALSWWWGRRAGPCMRCRCGLPKHRQAGRLPWCGLPRRRRWRPRRHLPRRLRRLLVCSLQPAMRTAPVHAKKQAVAVPALAAAVTAPPAARRSRPKPHWPAPRLATASEPARPLRWGRKTCAALQAEPVRRSASRCALFPHQRWTANAASNGATGGDMRLTEQLRRRGTRVTRVQRGAAVYCVEVPSANQPPAMVRRRASCCRATAPEQCWHGLHRHGFLVL